MVHFASPFLLPANEELPSLHTREATILITVATPIRHAIVPITHGC